jgi:HK97 family phage major capsid protein
MNIHNPEFIIKEDDDTDPVEAITKSLDDLKQSVDDKLDGIEKKGADTLDELKERMDGLEAKIKRPEGKSGGEEDDSERKAFQSYLRHGNAAPPDELKALNVTTDSQGGFIAPEEISTEMIRDITELSPVRSVASVRSIVSPSVKYPRRDGITNAQWEDEQETSEESTIPFGQTEVPAKKLMTFVDISNELLADSGGAAETEVRSALAEDFAQKEGEAFVAGDGVKSPVGLLDAGSSIADFNNGGTTVVKADALIKLMYSLPAAYRAQGTWMMNGTTLAAVRVLKDGQNNYLWQPSFQAGQPETLLGRPVIEAVDMPDIASAATPILFGDFSGYRIVDRLEMSVLVNPYLLATKGVTRIHATRRVGGKVIQPTKFKKLLMST